MYRSDLAIPLFAFSAGLELSALKHFRNEHPADSGCGYRGIADSDSEEMLASVHAVHRQALKLLQKIDKLRDELDGLLDTPAVMLDSLMTPES